MPIRANAGGSIVRALAVDGKAARGARRDDGRAVHLLAAMLHDVPAVRSATAHKTNGKHCKAEGGAVAVIASISGWKPALRPQYGTAKAAEIYLAIELGRELAPERIRVNAVSPGSILFPSGAWDSYRKRAPERFERFIERDLPFGRLGTPEEVADVLATPAPTPAPLPGNHPLRGQRSMSPRMNASTAS